MTKADILAQVRVILHDAFGIAPDKVHGSSKVYEDLDLDSIDAVDLLVRLKPLVGTRLTTETFQAARTIDDVVDALHAMLATASATASDS